MKEQRLNPNELAFETGKQANPELFGNDADSAYKAAVEDKFGWLVEVEKILRKAHEHGDERIPNEFKFKVDFGNGKSAIVLWLRNISKNITVNPGQNACIGERLGVVIGETDKPVIIGFSDGKDEKSLWTPENTRYHFRTFQQFEKEITPFDVEWLYGAWQQGVNFAYLLISDEKIDARIISACRNQEIRKYLVKRFGQERFKSGEGKLIHEEFEFVHPSTKQWCKIDLQDGKEIYHDDDNNIIDVPKGVEKRKTGQYLFDIEIDGRMHRFVFVKDASTDREYILEVPNTDRERRGNGFTESEFPINTVWQAVAWTFWKKPEEYNPVKET